MIGHARFGGQRLQIKMPLPRERDRERELIKSRAPLRLEGWWVGARDRTFAELHPGWELRRALGEKAGLALEAAAVIMAALAKGTRATIPDRIPTLFRRQCERSRSGRHKWRYVEADNYADYRMYGERRQECKWCGKPK